MTSHKAVHFGGGAIGRGLVGEKLHLSGYEVVFVDVMDKIIEDLQKNKEYKVKEIGADGEKEFTITNYRAINSKTHESEVVEEIATADLVTCAVGPRILRFIAPVIAKGIEARKADKPVAIVACENAIGATDTLAEFIKEKLSDETLDKLPEKARFANSAVDRIVPDQGPTAGLDVKIEKFYEWCVDQSPLEDYDFPKVKAIHYVGDLTPYIERKLFTVNTGHATAAYYGYQRKKAFIHDAMQDKEIHDIVRNVLSETAHLVCTKHDGIDPKEQQEYVDMIVDRISNPALEDNVTRVGRAPVRKLSRNERFIGPASQLAEMGEKVDGLLGSIEMALRFQNVEGDEESEELAKIMKENDAKEATKKLTGLEPEHPLFDRVVAVVDKVQKDTK